MNILIIGGYGFIGSVVAERFFKEGHSIFIIDNLSANSRDSLPIEHKFYKLDAKDEKCEEIFRVYNIDVLINFAFKQINTHLEQKENMLGLMNILSLGKQYAVKRIVCPFSSMFLDSKSVQILDFDGEKQVLKMDSAKHYQINAIDYCNRFRELFSVNITLVFLPNVYGSWQTRGVFATWAKRLFNNQPLVIFGDGNQTRDFLEVNDVADAFFRLVQRDCDKNEVIVSSNKETSINFCVDLFKKIARDNLEIIYEQERNNEQKRVVVQDDYCQTELGWKAKYDAKAGIKSFLIAYKQNLEKKQREKKSVERKALLIKYWFSSKPYLENICIFLLMIVLSQFVHDGTTVNPDIGLDYNYVYILTMGLLYGKKQSIPATVLASCLLAFNITQKFDDFVSMIYKIEYLVHFATYLFFGVLSGYITDNKDHTLVFCQKDMQELNQRYKFLEQLYLETINAKNRLYKQIVNSKDTLGSTYKIIQKLDSIELENIFTSITEVISEIMNTEHVAVYILGKNKYFLRQKTRIGFKTVDLPKSIKIENNDYLQEMMINKQVFVNKLLNPTLPDMAVPVLNNDEVMAVIQVYNLDFENMSLYNQNLLKVTSLLISDALRKAYEYEEQIYDKKHIPSTNILTKQEFAKIKREIYQNRRQRNISILAFTLEIIADREDIYEINNKISKLVRDEDFVGMAEDGKINIILWNIDENMVKQVQDRIKNAGLDSREVVDIYHGD